MTLIERETGTYRTSSGTLIHLRRHPDGTVLLEAEGATAGRLGGEELVKLSDDPDWPDTPRRDGDPQLFSD